MSELLSLLQQALAGRYSIERELGRGGMAIVYLAHDLKHRRRVAIKVLKPELVPALGSDRFLREIEIAAQLAHPNILPLHDSGEAGGLLYYVMPYVEGETLRERLNREKRLSSEPALHIANEVAEALAYAHDQGVVHRDIKPENILFQAGHAVVSDFGIARAVSRATDSGGAHLTESGVALGTLAYMSPEQALGIKELDGRSDIYSLGCVLHEMLTGEVPLLAPRMPPGGSGVQALEGRETVSPPLASVISKSLARLPSDRFASVAEFQEALVAASQSHVAAPGAHGIRRRRRWVRVAAIGSVLAVGAAVYYGVGLVRQSSNAGPSMKLAVLPLENLSGDSAQEYFSDGLTAEMITQLGRLHPQRLGVIARTSAMRYKNSEKTIDQIGRELGVDYILEGSARHDDGRVRITAQLIRLRGQTQLWSDSYERELSAVLRVQSDIAQRVARSLAIALLPTEQTRLAATRPVNPQAYEAFLRGRFHYEKMSPPDLDRAVHYFEVALANDPNYAPAYSGIAGVWVGRNQLGFASPSEATPKARAAAMKALELDSTSALARYALGMVAWAEWEWETSEREYQRTIELDPSFPEVRATYSHLLIALKRPQEAMAQAERGMQLDPFNAFQQGSYGVILYFARRYDEALVQLQKALGTSPDLPFVHCLLWHVFNITDKPQQAVQGAEGCIGHYSPQVKDVLARGYSEAGYPGAMRRVGDLLAVGLSGVYVAPIDVFIPYLHAGHNDLALDWLSKAIEARDPNVYGATADPFVNARLGDDPRFQDLVRRTRLPMSLGVQ